MTATVLKNPPKPGSDEWRETITASKAAAILGLDPFKTTGELWLDMAGITSPEPPSPELQDMWEWGHRAETALADWWLYKNPGWQCSRGEVAYSNRDVPMPNLVTLDRRARRGRAYHILECKTSNSRTIWSDDTTPPAHVIVQVIFQMGVSGIHNASIVRQLGSTVPVIYPVEWDADVFDGIVEVCEQFFHSLGNSEPPAPDPALLAAIKEKTGIIGEGVGEADPEIAAAYFARKQAFDQAEQALNEAKTVLVESMGDNQKLTLNGKTLISRSPGRFSQRNVPDDAKHLLKMPDVQTPKFDSKKFKEHYPEVYAAACGEPTVRIYG